MREENFNCVLNGKKEGKADKDDENESLLWKAVSLFLLKTHKNIHNFSFSCLLQNIYITWYFCKSNLIQMKYVRKAVLDVYSLFCAVWL